ncbi:MAG: sulfotransferase domain-containing protein [Acidothermaceae bacterium]
MSTSVKAAVRNLNPALYERARRRVQRTSWAVPTRLGMQRMPPAFMLAGFVKAGTTTLFDRLAAHPDVLPPRHRLLHYFSYEYERGGKWYTEQFPAVARARTQAVLRQRRPITGEGSPSYADHPLAPQRVHADFPDVRLIFLLRNPIERAYSHYNMSRRDGEEPLETFEEAVDAEEGRLAGEFERVLEQPNYRAFNLSTYSYLTRGRYAEHVNRWLAVFPREQVLLLTTEELTQSWAETMGRCWGFLGLRDIDSGPVQRLNSASYSSMNPATRERLREYFAPHNVETAKLLGRDPGWQ